LRTNEKTEGSEKDKKMKKKDFNILIVGVGGQGNILAGKIISQAFVAEGYDVKQSEVHGMAQRGGAVSSHVRAGEKIYSPLVPEESADFILSFEKMEVLRYLNYAGPSTRALINDLRVDPPSVSSGEQEYPADVLERIGKKTKSILVVDANGVAAGLGNERVVNSVLVGVLAAYLPLKKSTWVKMYGKLVAEKLLDINLKAFEAGMGLCGERACL
jgi:indolepyruvate ferredoxin oxidoreductase, beta subunit